MTVSLDNTKFKHYTGETPNGGASLGWAYDGDKLFVACAICSIKDHFSKREGRELILGRLQEEANGNTSPFSSTLNIDEVRDYLRGNIDNAFPVMTFRKANEIIDTIKFEDIKYDLFARISTDVFFG